MPPSPKAGSASAPRQRSPGDPNAAASFDGSNDTASAKLNLSGSSQLTLEFWLNWTAYANNDRLAFEFTPNFNNNDGGFLVDPNAGELGGKFGVAIGRGGSRNNAYFARPSAGAWHHYTLVFDTRHPRPSRSSRTSTANRSPTKRPPAAPARATSPTRASTSCRATRSRCSAAAASTRSRSTTAPSTPPRSPPTSTPASANRRWPPSPPPPTRSLPGSRPASMPRLPRTPTAPSSNTSGTSTATAATRPTRAKPPARARATTPPAT